MSDAGAVAVWCFSKPGVSGNTFEVHFNYWRFAREEKRTDFMEVGVLLNQPNGIDSICIFLPFVPVEDALTDLGRKFSEPAIAQGIFNELLSCTAHKNGHWVDLDRDQGEPHSRVLILGSEDDGLSQALAKVENLHTGVVITLLPYALELACEHISVDRRLYVRLRVAMPPGDENAFVKVIRPVDKLFQSGFEEIDFIDFRLNDPRTLPDVIEKQMRPVHGKSAAGISMVAFLTAVPLMSEVAISHEEAYKIRRLERDVWKTYVSGGMPEGMLVYHWKKAPASPEGVSDFAAFVKLQRRRSSWKTLTPYMTVAFVFGVAGNLVAALTQALPFWGSVGPLCEALLKRVGL